ncbi:MULTISPECIES: site-specific DNA-methyltransferase [Romboutsia]|jgi:adenine-specific DNA-methyltransferase|uniref:site-specific DNA-methyltransferase n=1 Tax=Romboutsia TaxID=1501226 RepID=UPI00217199A2|nr:MULTISPECIES: site-specific DNA-methyltransferase [Romboutsia]MCI9061300.1 site-specific DNA-methyltransferase [Romboutsia sp.]
MKMLEGISMDLTEDNLNKLKEIFPEVFEEGKIDFDKLRLILGDNIEDKEEKYEFTWNGKNDAIRIAQTPSTGTLRPDKESSKNWDDTENLYIEGDNLEVLKLLQKSYFGKVKMIYIDPPYNTGKDFIYKDSFKDNITNYKKITNQTTRANPETNGRYHTDWLNMMYPRLKLARNLLREDGVIFISIDDNEVNNLSKICNEIFGEENFIGCAGRITKKSNNKGDFWAPNFDYLLTYVKNINEAETFFGGVNYNAYNIIENEGPRKGEKYQLVRLYMSSLQARNPEQRFWIECPDGSKIIPPGSTFPPERPVLGDGIWRWTRKKIEEEKDKIVIKRVSSSNLIDENGEPAKWNIYTKTYLNDVIENSTAKPNSFIEDHINQIGSHEIKALDIPFDYSKPSTLIKYLIEISKSDKDAIILDFFSGSATTAHAIMNANIEDNGKRKYIMVQLPEKTEEKSEAYKSGYKNICEIGKERIRRVGDKIVSEDKEGIENLDIGFKVFKLDSSNLKSWDSSIDDLEQNIIEMGTNLKKDRTNEDLLYEILLKSGVELTAKIEEIKVGYNTIYNIGQGALLACLDDKITQDVIDEIPKHKSPFMETKVIFKEAGFMSDAAKINAIQNLKQFKIEDVRSV